jgi:hypothetical protein
MNPPKFKAGDRVRFTGETYDSDRCPTGRTGAVTRGPKTGRGRNYEVLLDGDDGVTAGQRPIVIYAEHLEAEAA